jgi:nucleoid-associated protein YejK
MASITSNELVIHGLQKSQATALRKKARQMGLTSEDYVRELIASDLELDNAASAASFAELAIPFQKALGGISEANLDKLSRTCRRKDKR